MQVTIAETQVLDHGYVKLVESWGSDERIIEAARMSTQKGFEGWGPACPMCKGPVREGLVDGFGADVAGWVCDACSSAVDPKAGDEKLLAYLWKNNHATPFEMAGCVIEVKAPVFTLREWHRHRTQSYNEMSARYAPLPDENYLPSVDRLMLGGGHLTKQAGAVADAPPLTRDQAALFQELLRVRYTESQSTYKTALDIGVPKELARLVLPVARYSRMRASANLRNWLGFLTLRMAPQAQWEIVQYANAVHEILKLIFPRTISLFDSGRR